ncbi:MAG: DEAD/DEAH box helicase [Sphingomonadales bacterium]
MPFPATHPALARALAARDYAEPTPVQSAVLEADAGGRDLLVSAQTGSGKTVAFGLALAPTLLDDAEAFGEPGAPLALIIAPTRELALQVHRELTWLYDETGARIVTCVGGMDPRQEARALGLGAQIVVGTPGRLRDHMERGRLDTSGLRAVVLDEADEMLDMGFREDLEFILDATPGDRRTLMFSATIAREIAALASSYQRDALRIDTLQRNRPHADIEYRAIRVAPTEVELGVVNVLRLYDAGAALVFCATREAVRHLHAGLVERGFAAVALSGEMTQNERNNALQSLRDGRTKICVATDVAARGLDLPQLDLVVHAELPNNKETLLHRSGRTGRAGRKGVCVLIVPYTRGRRATQLLSFAGVQAQWSGPPTAEEIHQRDNERFLADPVFEDASPEEDMSLVEALVATRSPEQLALALARIHRARLPEPEDLIDNQRDGRRDERAPREPRQFNDRGPAGETVWFRLNVGRQKNADPRWILPLLCRLGHVTKRDIGAIRIFDRDTKFEISKDVAERFQAALARSDEQEFSVYPAEAPAPRDRRDREERGPRPERREQRERTEPLAESPREASSEAPEPPQAEMPLTAHAQELRPRDTDRPARKKERWDGAKRREARARRDHAPESGTPSAPPASQANRGETEKPFREKSFRGDSSEERKASYKPKPWKQGPRPDAPVVAERDPSKPARRPQSEGAPPEKSFRNREKGFGKPKFGKGKLGAERPKRFNPRRDEGRPGDRPLRRKPR